MTILIHQALKILHMQTVAILRITTTTVMSVIPTVTTEQTNNINNRIQMLSLTPI